ncbi:hypothetical protein WNY78_01365 [Psychroserpens sp. AS72]|uniref:hypothetical protein n=1 Tax=Psychroserpens sp. AS72 TaxID=3135775 RepID=UPI00316F52C4
MDKKNDTIYTTKKRLIKTILSINNSTFIDWETIREDFNTVYPNFFTAILIKDIDLSTKEEHFAMLEKLHINTHTIARVLDILPDSVYTNRYRLNKKFKKSDMYS